MRRERNELMLAIIVVGGAIGGALYGLYILGVREVYGNASCFQFEKSNETDGWCTTLGVRCYSNV